MFLPVDIFYFDDPYQGLSQYLSAGEEDFYGSVFSVRYNFCTLS